MRATYAAKYDFLNAVTMCPDAERRKHFLTYYNAISLWLRDSHMQWRYAVQVFTRANYVIWLVATIGDMPMRLSIITRRTSQIPLEIVWLFFPNSVLPCLIAWNKKNFERSFLGPWIWTKSSRLIVSLIHIVTDNVYKYMFRKETSTIWQQQDSN